MPEIAGNLRAINDQMKFRSSNVPGTCVLLLGLLTPLVGLWLMDLTWRPFAGCCVVLTVSVALMCVYVSFYELNKGTGRFVQKRLSLFGNKTLSFPLDEIRMVRIKHRWFAGGYRSGNPHAFQVAIVRMGGEEITLTGWRSSTSLQDLGLSIANFLCVPAETVPNQ